MTIDHQRGRLYLSYTEVGVQTSPPDNLTNGQIELAVCDIGKADGTAGPQGGKAGQPVCFPGKTGKSGSTTSPGSPYFIVARGNLSCEQEGAYPAVDVHTGAVYVAYEFNLGTNIFGSFGGPTNCLSTPAREVVNYIPFPCLALAAASACDGGPTATHAVNIISMDAAYVPGYNRFPMNDFPQIAVSDPAGTVSIVWNDARLHPYGDILLQSLALQNLAPIQSRPVRLNSSTSGWHLMPAMRTAEANGDLDVSFYGRSSANTTLTNVYAALGVDPRTTNTPANNILITTGPSDWSAVSSDILPNFGDYTDNYLIASTSAPYVGNILYVAWSDGRLGVPQPFEDHLSVS
jgi:hypothetical protein